MEAPDMRGFGLVVMVFGMIAGVLGVILWEILVWLSNHLTIIWN